MLYWQKGKNRILIKITSFILIQTFLLTNLGLSEPLYNRNISSSYIDSKGLRVPVGLEKRRFEAALGGSTQSIKWDGAISNKVRKLIESYLTEVFKNQNRYRGFGGIVSESATFMSDEEIVCMREWLIKFISDPTNKDVWATSAAIEALGIIAELKPEHVTQNEADVLLELFFDPRLSGHLNVDQAYRVLAKIFKQNLDFAESWFGKVEYYLNSNEYEHRLAAIRLIEMLSQYRSSCIQSDWVDIIKKQYRKNDGLSDYKLAEGYASVLGAIGLAVSNFLNEPDLMMVIEKLKTPDLKSKQKAKIIETIGKMMGGNEVYTSAILRELKVLKIDNNYEGWETLEAVAACMAFLPEKGEEETIISFAQWVIDMVVTRKISIEKTKNIIGNIGKRRPDLANLLLKMILKIQKSELEKFLNIEDIQITLLASLAESILDMQKDVAMSCINEITAMLPQQRVVPSDKIRNAILLLMKTEAGPDIARTLFERYGNNLRLWIGFAPGLEIIVTIINANPSSLLAHTAFDWILNAALDFQNKAAEYYSALRDVALAHPMEFSITQLQKLAVLGLSNMDEASMKNIENRMFWELFARRLSEENEGKADSSSYEANEFLYYTHRVLPFKASRLNSELALMHTYRQISNLGFDRHRLFEAMKYHVMSTDQSAFGDEKSYADFLVGSIDIMTDLYKETGDKELVLKIIQDLLEETKHRFSNEYNRALIYGNFALSIARLYTKASDKEKLEALKIIENDILIKIPETENMHCLAYQAIGKLFEEARDRKIALEIIYEKALMPIQIMFKQKGTWSIGYIMQNSLTAINMSISKLCLDGSQEERALAHNTLLQEAEWFIKNFGNMYERSPLKNIALAEITLLRAHPEDFKDGLKILKFLADKADNTDTFVAIIKGLVMFGINKPQKEKQAVLTTLQTILDSAEQLKFCDVSFGLAVCSLGIYRLQANVGQNDRFTQIKKQIIASIERNSRDIAPLLLILEMLQELYQDTTMADKHRICTFIKEEFLPMAEKTLHSANESESDMVRSMACSTIAMLYQGISEKERYVGLERVLNNALILAIQIKDEKSRKAAIQHIARSIEKLTDQIDEFGDKLPEDSLKLINILCEFAPNYKGALRIVHESKAEIDSTGINRQKAIVKLIHALAALYQVKEPVATSPIIREDYSRGSYVDKEEENKVTSVLSLQDNILQSRGFNIDQMIKNEPQLLISDVSIYGLRYAQFIIPLLSIEQILSLLKSDKVSPQQKIIILVSFYNKKKSNAGIEQLRLSDKDRQLLDLADEYYVNLYSIVPDQKALFSALAFQGTVNGLEQIDKFYTASGVEARRDIIAAVGEWTIQEAGSWLVRRFSQDPQHVARAFVKFIEDPDVRLKFAPEQRNQWEQDIVNSSIRESLGTWQGVEEVLGLLPELVGHRSLMELFTRWLVVALRLQPYRREGFGNPETIENLPGRLTAHLESVFEAENDMEAYPHLRRLIKTLPLSRNIVVEVREAAINLSRALYGIDSRRDFVGDLRDRIHNRPSPQHLKIAQAYKRYLDYGDSSELDALGYSILAQDPGSFQSLKSDPVKLQRLKDALAILIDRLDQIYGSGSLRRLTQMYQETDLTGQPDLKASFDPLIQMISISSSRQIAGSVDLGTFDIDKLFNVSEYLVKAKKAVYEVLYGKHTPNEKLIAARLDIELDLLSYQVANCLIDQIEKSIDVRFLPFILLSLVRDLISLTRTQLGKAEQDELLVIEKDINTLNLTAQESSREMWLRYFSISERIERLIVSVSKATAALYQEQADIYAEAVNISDNHNVNNFAANILREEPVYQLSLIIERLKQQLIEQIGFRWVIARSGKTMGRLIYIDDPESMQEAVDKFGRSLEPVIIIAEWIPEGIVLNTNICGLISFGEQGILSHIAIRADQTGTVLVRPLHRSDYNALVDMAKKRSRVELRADNLNVTVNKIKNGEPNVLVDTTVKTIMPHSVNLLQRGLLQSKDYSPETVGPKAMSLEQLAGLIENHGASVPSNVSLPFGYFEALLDANGRIGQEIRKLKAGLNRSKQPKTFRRNLARLRELIGQLEVPITLMAEIQKSIGDGPWMVRSSTNAEDLPDYPGAGLYDSFPGVMPKYLAQAILRVYQSLYSDYAFEDRRRVGMDEQAVYPAIIIQRMVAATYSFVIHTKDPTNGAGVLIEAVSGLGEVLVSGKREFQGTPHRFRYDPETGGIKRLAFANKSYKLMVLPAGGTEQIVADYTKDDLTMLADVPEWLRILGMLAVYLEVQFGTPQDIEGAIEFHDGNVVIQCLQSRSQIVLRLNGHKPVIEKDASLILEELGKPRNSSI